MSFYTVRVDIIIKRKLQIAAWYLVNVSHCSRKSAVRKIENIEKMIISLESDPARIPVMLGEPFHKMGIRRVTVEDYSIFFTIDDNAMTVDVFDIYPARSVFENELMKYM